MKLIWRSITTGNDVQSGVLAGEELVEFAEAGLGDNVEHIARARNQLEEVVGTEGHGGRRRCHGQFPTHGKNC